MIFILFILLILLNLFIIFKLDSIRNIIKIYDFPDSKRKFHSEPMFIGGGMIIFTNYLLIIIYNLLSEYPDAIINLNTYQSIFSWVFGSIFIFILGIYDDKKNLNGNIKFLLQSIIYISVIYFDKNLILNNLEFKSLPINISLGNYSFIFTYLCLMIFSNAFNMLDGINLQTGVYTILIFLFICLKIGFSYDLVLLILSILTYLYLNFKHKLFLGDSGTYLLSFIISLIFIKTYNSDKSFYCDEIFMIMILPGLELIRLFLFRALKGKNPLSPDRNHIHHLIQNKFKKFNFVKISILTNSIYFIFCSLFLIYSNIIFIILSIIFYIISINLLLKN